jgi:transcriptional regulator with XRE-family HTH domain
MAQTLGDRLRDSRVSRGLSQSALARGLVSPSYVSLIESGRRLPEREVLEAFAERLGTTSEYLRTGADAATAREELLNLRYAELALANGQLDEALRGFQELTRSSLLSRHQAEWGMARTLEARGDLSGAIQRIEWLLEEHRAGRADAPGLLVLLNDQCRLYREAGDLNHSITLGEGALDEVRRIGLTGTEEEIRLASTLVASYWERGDWVRANLLATEVVARAEAHGSPRARGSAYWNASLAASSVGGVTLAIELAERAIAMFSETDDERGTARLRTAFAWLLLYRRPADLPRIEELLTKAYSTLSEIGVDTDLAYCETELARYHLVAGDAAQALTFADRSIARLAERNTAESVRVRVLRGFILAALGEHEQSLQSCRDSIRLLSARNRSRHDMTIWREAAELLVRLGEPDEAIEAYRALADWGGAPEPVWLAAARWSASETARGHTAN